MNRPPRSDLAPLLILAWTLASWLGAGVGDRGPSSVHHAPTADAGEIHRPELAAGIIRPILPATAVATHPSLARSVPTGTRAGRAFDQAPVGPAGANRLTRVA